MPHTAPSRPLVSAADFERHEDRLHVLLGLFGIWHLDRVRREFDGDLLSGLILGEVAHHNIVAMVSGGALESQQALGRMSGPDLEGRLLPCNVHSIAIACDIPRETVRRKVAALVERGWLRRGSKGDLFVTRLPGQHFRQFNIDFADRLLRAAGELHAILSDKKV